MILRSQRLENANSKLLDLDDKTKLVMGGTDSCKGNMNFSSSYFGYILNLNLSLPLLLKIWTEAIFIRANDLCFIDFYHVV